MPEELNTIVARRPAHPRDPLLIAGILVLVFIFFWPLLKGGFIWDDEYNLLNNPHYRGLTWDHLAWMFSTFHDGNYHPLCWLSLGLDFVVWGLNPAGYHLTNLILHGLNAVLCYYLITALLKRVEGFTSTAEKAITMGAAGGALFFALHPLRVETVAWISARGDTLCGIFYFLTLLAYLRIDYDNEDANRRAWVWISLVCMLCSLLARAWGITLPVVLLLLDIYPLRRLQFNGHWLRHGRRILLEKIPYALLAVLFGILAILAKKQAMVAVDAYSMADRLLQSIHGLCFYVWKSVVPLDLSPLYGLRQLEAATPANILCVLAVVLITGGLLLGWRRWPGLLTAWSCYVVIISPQLVADRYSYFACLPFAVIFGGALGKMWLIRNKLFRVSGLLVCAGLLVLLGILSSRQTSVWQNELNFWNRVLHLDPHNSLAINMRARLKFETLGDMAGAEADYSRALQLAPDNQDALVNRGLARLQLKRYAAADADFQAAIRLDATQPTVFNGIGLLHYQQGRTGEALEAYTRAIGLDPDFADSYINRGVIYREQGDLISALKDFNAAVGLAPASPEGYANRGTVFQARRENALAARDYQTALRLAPPGWAHRQAITQILQQLAAASDTQLQN